MGGGGCLGDDGEEVAVLAAPQARGPQDGEPDQARRRGGLGGGQEPLRARGVGGYVRFRALAPACARGPGKEGLLAVRIEFVHIYASYG